MLVYRALSGFLFHSIVTLVARDVSISRAFRILLDWIVGLVSRTLLGFSFIRLLRQYLAHVLDSLPFDCSVNISHTFRILFLLIVALVSCALVGFSFMGLLRQYLPNSWIPFDWIVTLVSRTLLGFSLIRLLRQYLVHFQDSL